MLTLPVLIFDVGVNIFAIEFEAESIQRTGSRQTYVLKNGTLDYNGYVFSATRIEYDETEKTVNTVGLTTIVGDMGQITGYDVAYSEKTGIITADKIIYFDPVKKYYIEAEKIRIYKNKFYFELDDAVLTNCNPEEPGWHVRFSYLKYYPNSFAYGYNARYYMHGVPGLYAPIFALPTVTERASGFLVPQIKYAQSENPSKSTGFRLQTPIFFNLGQDHDLTVTPDFIGKRGTGLGLEYNYAFIEGMRGTLYAWQIDESNANRRPEDEYLMLSGDNPNPRRRTIRYSHRQRMFADGTVYLNYEKYSDNEVVSEYFGETPSKKHSEKVDLKYIYTWSGGFLTLGYLKNTYFLNQSIYNKSTDYKTALSKEPELVIAHNFYDAPFKFFNTSIHNRLTRYYRLNGWIGQRNIFTPKFSFNDTWGFLTTTFDYTEHLYNYNVRYQNDENDLPVAGDGVKTEKTVHHRIAEIDVRTELELYRPISGYDGPSEFSIKPSVSVHYTQDTDQRHALSAVPGSVLGESGADYSYKSMFDGNDRTYGYYTLTNRLDFTYRHTGKQNRRKIWGVSLYQIYDLWRKKTEAETEAFFSGPFIDEIYRETEYGDMRLPLRIESYFSPVGGYKLTTFSRYDYKIDTLTENTVRIDISGKRKSRFGAGYYQNMTTYKELNNTLHSKRHQLTFNTEFHFLSYWRFSHQTVFDLNRQYNATDKKKSARRVTHFTARLEKNDPCYSFFVQYDERLKSNTLDEYVDRAILFGIQIKTG